MTQFFRLTLQCDSMKIVQRRCWRQEAFPICLLIISRPKNIVPRLFRMQMFNPIPFVAMLLFKLSKWG